jgi:hypothetical protein
MFIIDAGTPVGQDLSWRRSCQDKSWPTRNLKPNGVQVADTVICLITRS